MCLLVVGISFYGKVDGGGTSQSSTTVASQQHDFHKTSRFVPCLCTTGRARHVVSCSSSMEPCDLLLGSAGLSFCRAACSADQESFPKLLFRRGRGSSSSMARRSGKHSDIPRLRLRIMILRASSGVTNVVVVGEHETLLFRLLFSDLLAPGLVLQTEFFRLFGPE